MGVSGEMDSQTEGGNEVASEQTHFLRKTKHCVSKEGISLRFTGKAFYFCIGMCGVFHAWGSMYLQMPGP